jgi:hypothetical protein
MRAFSGTIADRLPLDQVDPGSSNGFDAAPRTIQPYIGRSSG